MVDGDKPKDKGIDGGSSDVKLNIYDPLYLHPHDIGSQLITFKLEGTENYKVWSAAVELALHTRNKIGFINGKCVRDVNKGPLQDQWDKCNVVVLSWLLGCVSQNLYKGQVFSKNSKDVWDELKETYNKQDGSPLPDVKSAFATLARDESHRNSHSSSKTTKAGPTAFADRPSNNNNWNPTRTVCNHCNMSGHTIERCFELVGYPTGFKRNNNGQTSSNNADHNNNIDHNKSAPHTLTSDQNQRSLLSDTGS
ncbi:ribonuclease H-like domain-containing protein [Tanacetum coccineum]